MKTIKSCFVVSFFLGLIILFPVSAAAQEPSTGIAGNPLSNGQKMLYERVKGNILRSAEKMPEDKFGFKPVPEVKSFAQILGHIADVQSLFCSPVLGEEYQASRIEQTKTHKAELTQALGDAFAYCDRAYDSMTDAQAAQIVKFFGGDQAKLSVLSFNVSHINEHYGNLVTYMRINGLVPPSSEPRSKPKQ